MDMHVKYVSVQFIWIIRWGSFILVIRRHAYIIAEDNPLKQTRPVGNGQSLRVKTLTNISEAQPTVHISELRKGPLLMSWKKCLVSDYLSPFLWQRRNGSEVSDIRRSDAEWAVGTVVWDVGHETDGVGARIERLMELRLVVRPLRLVEVDRMPWYIIVRVGLGVGTKYGLHIGMDWKHTWNMANTS